MTSNGQRVPAGNVVLMWISWISRLGAAATAVDAIIEPATTAAAAPVARRLSVDTIRFSRCGFVGNGR
jgi:hypothetical protein